MEITLSLQARKCVLCVLADLSVFASNLNLKMTALEKCEESKIPQSPLPNYPTERGRERLIFIAASTMRAAASRLDISGNSSTPSGDTSVIRFVSTSNPESEAETSFATIRSAPFSLSFFFAFSIRFSVSAANPITIREPLVPPTAARMSSVGSSLSTILSPSVGRSIIGDRCRHDNYCRVIQVVVHLLIHLRGRAH